MSEYKPNPEIVKFWAENCLPIFSAITAGSYWLTTIQIRYEWARKEIAKRHKNPLKIIVSDAKTQDFVGENIFLPFGSNLDGDTPKIAIFVPDVLEEFLNIQKRHGKKFRQVFEACIVVGFMHEFDHFALGLAPSNMPLPDEMARIESIVWADTCEYTIRFFCEVYGYELCYSDRLFYGKWLECGRNRESILWKSFIASYYTKIQRHN